MPTPYGSRGGMAFSADELRVLRRALAVALHPDQPREGATLAQDCLRLAESVDEVVREADRQRAFLLADLVRYRDALPGSAGGYLELLQEALATGYDPGPDDLAALRTLPHRAPAAPALLDRCRRLAEQSVRARLAARVTPGSAVIGPAAAPGAPRASRVRLQALPGGRAGSAGRPPTWDGEKRDPRPADPKPAPGPAPRPDRPIPTPGEVFPPRRKPAPPAKKRVAG
ncbi:hypothetical protein V1460_34150 [Streptomyces sp. SCSIO 30461]|uniref:hypothetical protein n=1 Tax=Streptomyces sp. SCSIO 30461 TaxID=3118085 RepID=UPI0030D59E66